MQINHFCLFGLFYIFDMLFRMGMGSISNKQVSVAILSRLGDFGLRLTGLCWREVLRVVWRARREPEKDGGTS